MITCRISQIPLWRQLLLIIVVLISVSWAAGISRETVRDDPFLLYPYTLASSSRFGRIPDSALPGSKVPVDDSLPHPHSDSDEAANFLRLKLGHNPYFNQSTTLSNTSASENSDKEKTGDPSAMTSLPKGVIWNVSAAKSVSNSKRKGKEKALFSVDTNFNIVVQNNKEFTETDEFEFWVVAIRQVSDNQYEAVSNPLSFVITVDHTQPKKEGAVIYVGIVVLVVCLFALLIPLTVRTKRRMREGKPLCVCGSSQEKLEERKRKEAGNGNDIATISDGQGPHDVAALLHNHPKRESSGGASKHETVQQKNLRSVSDHNFQPRWLDPHYTDVYERPEYKALSSLSPSSIVVTADSNGGASEAAASTSDRNVVERL